MTNFTKELKMGDECPEVLEVKLFLSSHGFDKALFKKPDGTVYSANLSSDNSYFSEVLAEILNNWKAKVIALANEINIPEWAKENWKIEVDGKVDYNTWLIMYNYDRLLEHYGASINPDEIITPESKGLPEKNFVNVMIATAKSEVGVHENDSTNTGIKVNEYQNAGSNGAFKHGGNPWCFFFLQWCWLKTCEALGLSYKDHYYGYTPDGVAWGKKKNICEGGKSGGGHVSIDKIDVGDLGFIYSSSRDNACHIFLIAAKGKDYVTTIEGNTNTAGSRDGGSVAIRKRPVSQVWAVVKIWKLYEVTE